ncbi:MAG: DnaD domain protein [Clostridia bacterium]
MYIFEDSKAFLYSDTPVPDIFISEYLPEMTGVQVKVYLYCLFLSNHRKKISEIQFAKTFGISENEILAIFDELLEKGLFQKKGKSYFLVDLKDKEITKLYKPRSVRGETDLDAKKNIMSTISKSFFQGIMPISWYTNIEMWFNLYKFEDDVMYSLFNYCSERGLLKYSYVNAVAKNWSDAGIKNSFDLDEYFMKYKKMKDVSAIIAKKLKRRSPFTEYEERYIKKWVDDYGYGMEIIELALKNSVKISSPNLEYFHKILTDWNKKGLRTKSQIEGEAARYAQAKSDGGIDDVMLKKKVREHYEKLKANNEQTMGKRKSEVFLKAPEIQKLLSDIANLSIDSLSMKKSDKQDAFSQIDIMKDMAGKLLVENGFPQNYLEPVYECNECSDTGVLPDGSSCDCRKELIKQIKS